MKTGEDIKDDLQTEERLNKRVKFSENTKDNPIFTPLAKPHASAVRRVWIQRSRDGDYVQLKNNLISYQSKGIKIEDFFRKEGRILLDWAISSSPSAEPLDFICNNISKELLKEMLGSKDFSLLNTFLLGEEGMEELRQITPERLKNRHKKIKLFLNIDPAGVTEFLEKNMVKKNIGSGVKASIKKVLAEVASIQPTPVY